MTLPIDITFESTELGAREGIARVISALTERGLSQDHLGTVEIALAESVNNIIEHAFAGLAPDVVRVRLLLERNLLVLTIHDNGNALPNEEMPPGDPADLQVARSELPEGGFGWFLIRELTTTLSYVRKDGSNILTLQFDLGSDSN
ncbi:MAG: ATP-binding protein [Sedimentitalea sp.]